MSILIRGMEMPKERLNQERISITIWADGSVTNDGDYFRNEDGSYRKEYWNYEQFSAVELPPHGDLIDRDVLKTIYTEETTEWEALAMKYKDDRDDPVDIFHDAMIHVSSYLKAKNKLMSMPTIIEAEVEE